MKTNLLNEFRSRFEYINDETLYKAAVEDPNFLVEFIKNAEIKDYTRAISIIALGQIYNPDYIEFIKSFKKNESPLVRESVYMSLNSYIWDDETNKYAYLIKEYEQDLLKENSPGVRKRIEESIEFVKLMTQ